MGSNFMMHFHGCQLLRLEELMCCICKPDYNARGVAQIEVSRNGMKLSFKQHESGVLGVIYIKPSSIPGFHCNRGIEAVINVRKMTRILFSASLYTEGVIISHDIDSDQLTFNYGDDGGNQVHLKLMQTLLDVDTPGFEVMNSTSVSTQMLSNIMSKIEQEKIKYVKFDMNTQIVTEFDLGEDGSVRVQSDRYDNVWFTLEHSETMRAAFNLTQDATIKLLKEPSDFITLQFEIQGLGYLEFMIRSNVQLA